MVNSPGLPPIFAETPTELVPAEAIATFPVNTFLESIAVSVDNTLFVTSHYDGSIWCIEADHQPVLHAKIAGKAAGLVLLPDGNLLLSAWDQQNLPTVFNISPEGETSVLVTLPDAVFLNGMTPLDSDRILIADSYRGAIWQLTVSERKVDIWLEHPHLARSSSDNEFPAVNGLKIFEGVLYASNTEKMQLVKIPIVDGQSGEPEVFVSPVNLDDFAFDDQGNLYGTTHIYNSVVKISSRGDITIIAGAAEGMTGSTALAFGRGEGDRTSIYVVTNGGMSFPPSTGVEPGRVVCLKVEIPGLQIGE
ncbi:MAG: gluconolactonase [Leptolyngbyaceae cyanobacterium SL_5_9]|nr:gluconolactonase [Leptolyngbyaceae cyanobacterium SL_5_9]